MELTRRNFLKGTAIGAAGLSAMGIVGCASPAAGASAGAKSVPEDDAAGLFDSGIEEDRSLDDASYEVDVVVIGGGAAGMAACATAAEQGLSVLLVEANSAVGGTTQFAEGIAGVNTKIQQDQGKHLDVQELVSGELVFSNYCADARLIRGFLDGADDDIEWLQGMGVEFYPETINVTQHLYVGQGKAMIEKVNDYALEKGAQIITDTKARKLFVEGGKVRGVLCESKSGDVIVKAGSTILACGGYIQNGDMMDALQRFSHDRVKITAAPGHDGAHMNMAYSAGADQTGITLMHFIWAALDGFDLHSQLSTAACNEAYFWVDSHGRRFCDESLVTNPSCIDNVILNQKRAISILTDAEAQRLATEGCSIGWGSYVFAGSQMTDLPAELAKAKQDRPDGFFYGDTIEDLAGELGIDAATLKQTISDYNAMVAAGVDDEFGKPAPFLREVPENGPFYAFELKCSAFCTMGGIRVNQQNEVLDANFDGIEGLYCAGVDCSGLQGTTYCMGIGGGAQGYAVYSGRNAARNAAERLGK